MGNRRIGVDIGQLVNPFRGDISGFALAANTSNDISRQLQAMRDQQDQVAHQEEQRRLAREQMAEQGRQFDLHEVGVDLRQDKDLDAARAKFEAEMGYKQRGLDADVVGSGVEAFRRGDMNALEGIQARAGLLAPGISFSMKGPAPAPSQDTGTFGEDAAFAPLSLAPGLTIRRGQERLYSADQAAVRQREKDIAGSALAPLQSGLEGHYMTPALTAGLSAAGSGLSGEEAVKMAIESADKAAQRGTSRENSRMMSMQKSQQMGSQETYKLHNEVQDIAGRVAKIGGLDKLDKRQQELDAFVDDINSGVPFQQNVAKMSMMKELIKGAASDRDASRFENAAGFWNQLEGRVNQVIAGGEVPKDLREQMLYAVNAMKTASELKRSRMGQQARDQVYSSPFLPVQDETSAVAAGLQADTYITGHSFSPEEFNQELARYRQLQMRRMTPAPASGVGSVGGGVSMRGDIVPPPGGVGGLGVAPVDGRPPRPPRQSAPADVQQPMSDPNAEADALLMRINAGQ